MRVQWNKRYTNESAVEQEIHQLEYSGTRDTLMRVQWNKNYTNESTVEQDIH